MGPGIFIVAASYATDVTTVVALFTVAMSILGAFYCSLKVNSNDLSPNYAGSLMGVINGTGAVAGIIAPLLCGLMTENVFFIVEYFIRLYSKCV